MTTPAITIPAAIPPICRKGNQAFLMHDWDLSGKCRRCGHQSKINLKPKKP